MCPHALTRHCLFIELQAIIAACLLTRLCWRCSCRQQPCLPSTRGTLMDLLCLQGSNFRCLGRSDPDTTPEAPPCTGLQPPSMTHAAPLPMLTATGSDSLAAQGWLFDLQMPVFPEQLLNAEQAVC